MAHVYNLNYRLKSHIYLNTIWFHDGMFGYIYIASAFENLRPSGCIDGEEVGNDPNFIVANVDKRGRVYD